MAYLASRLNVLIAIAGIAGPSVKVAADIVAAVNNPNYDPKHQSISQLEVGPVSWLARLGSVGLIPLIVIFLLGLADDLLKGHPRARNF